MSASSSVHPQISIFSWRVSFEIHPLFDKYELIYNPETEDIHWGMPVFNPDYDIMNLKMILDGPPIEFSSQLTG